MGNNDKKHSVDLFFILLVFLGMLLACMVLISVGSTVFQKTVDSMNRSYTSRTPGAYVMQKLRQCDRSADAVTIGELDGRKALLLHEEYGDVPYVTYLYEHGGKLMELFAEESITDLPATAGSEIIDIGKIDYQIKNNTLFITISTNDYTKTYLYDLVS